MTLDIGEAQPTYQTIDPATGLVGADFSGHVHAGGLDLDAGTSATPPNQDKIRWLRTSDGAVVASIFGYELNNSDDIYVQATATSDTRSANVGYVANSHDNTSQTGITLNAANAGVGEIDLTVGNLFVVALNALGQSGFIQFMGALSQRQINFGVGSFVGGGGAPQAVNQAHGLMNPVTGLGVTPGFWIAFPDQWDSAGTAGQPITAASNPDGANLHLSCWRSGAGFAAGTTYFYWWVAAA